MTRFLAALGDRINPIVVKETRQAVSSRLVAGFLLLFLGIELAVVLLMITAREGSNSDNIDLRAGREIFSIVQGILLGTCMILIPTMTAMRLASERSDVNVDLLFISSLSPRSVLSGKLFAAAALALVIFSAAAPFMTFAYVMRGLDVPTIFIILLADFLAVLVATSFLLLIASMPAPRGLRIILGLLGFIFVCWMGAGLLAASSNFLRYGSGMDTTSREFWLGVGGLTLAILGAIGLFFVWAVALVSPPAANRAFGVRVYTVGLWLLEAVICGIWSWWIGSPEPMIVWGFIGTIWFSLQMLIAICERDSWGPRVVRRIPRNPVLWLPAFLFYSGAAGGMLFAVLGCLCSIVGMAFWSEVVSSSRGPRGKFEWEAIEVAGLIAGYAFCYSMTAVMFRRLFAGSSFRIGYTWLVAGILFGLGCTIPFILRFAFISDRTYGYPEETIWLYLPNPVVIIEYATGRSNPDLGLPFGFLALWAAAVTLLNAPWLIKQIGTFRRRVTDA